MTIEPDFDPTALEKVLGGPSEILDCYRTKGRAQGDFTPFHQAFAFYRMAIIFEGITARAKAGQATSANALKVDALAPVCARLAENILSKDVIRL